MIRSRRRRRSHKYLIFSPILFYLICIWTITYLPICSNTYTTERPAFNSYFYTPNPNDYHIGDLQRGLIDRDGYDASGGSGYGNVDQSYENHGTVSSYGGNIGKGDELSLLLASTLYGLKSGVIVGSLLGIVKLLIFSIPLFSILSGLLFMLKGMVFSALPNTLLPSIVQSLQNAGLITTTPNPNSPTTPNPNTTPATPATTTTAPPNTGLPIITTLPPILTTLLPSILPTLLPTLLPPILPYHAHHGIKNNYQHPHHNSWQYYDHYNQYYKDYKY